MREINEERLWIEGGVEGYLIGNWDNLVFWYEELNFMMRWDLLLFMVIWDDDEE